jgi:hypothetical protein
MLNADPRADFSQILGTVLVLLNLSCNRVGMPIKKNIYLPCHRVHRRPKRGSAGQVPGRSEQSERSSVQRKVCEWGGGREIHWPVSSNREGRLASRNNRHTETTADPESVGPTHSGCGQPFCTRRILQREINIDRVRPLVVEVLFFSFSFLPSSASRPAHRHAKTAKLSSRGPPGRSPEPSTDGCALDPAGTGNFTTTSCA